MAPNNGGVEEPGLGSSSETLPSRSPALPAPTADELRLLEALRRRDESAFTELVDRYHNSLLRLARLYVKTHAVAEEVVQETWVGVLQGIDRFEGRSSLKTWLFRILMNRAKTRGQREARMVPFSALSGSEDEAWEPAVDPARFRGPEDQYPGHWLVPLGSWGENPEKTLLSDEVRRAIEKAIESLPDGQRAVITLRDVQGWTADEVCNTLGISETNQRVLLHRARSKVRGVCEHLLNKA